VKLSQAGRASYSAPDGQHDDLVTALGRATQATPARVYIY
jgi:hypothetical protein